MIYPDSAISNTLLTHSGESGAKEFNVFLLTRVIIPYNLQPIKSLLTIHVKNRHDPNVVN